MPKRNPRLSMAGVFSDLLSRTYAEWGSPYADLSGTNPRDSYPLRGLTRNHITL